MELVFSDLIFNSHQQECILRALTYFSTIENYIYKYMYVGMYELIKSSEKKIL